MYPYETSWSSCNPVPGKGKKFISPSSTKGYPLVVKSAKGMVVTDVDDNTFLDFTAGVAVCNTGHNHDQASTFGGNLVSCHAVLTTIKLLENGLIDNAAKQGAYLINELRKLECIYPIIGDVRGLGLMLAVEIVKDKETKEYAPEVRNGIIQKAFSRGLLLLGCGRSAIRFCPPLILSKDDADIALSIFEECLKENLQNKL